MTTVRAPDDDALLDALLHDAVGYFIDCARADNGLVPDNSRPGAPISIAVVGFALSVYPVAVAHGWLRRTEAVTRTLAILRFLAASDQSGSPDATGYRGFYYHFLDPDSGRRVWRSELSMVDTALLIAGALTARQYFDGATADEASLRELADALYRRIDWRWAQNGGSTIMQGWKPECGFLHYGWEGYNEALVLYVLALGSPAHPIHAGGYGAWTATYQWENLYGHDFLYAGPLFIHQFSHAWIDFRGIRDAFMREKRCDYFENSRRATEVQREYALRNPLERAGYGGNVWGLTACDGPGDFANARGITGRRFFGYAARGVPFGPDDGTLAGWGAVASLPFAPEIALAAVRDMRDRYREMVPGGRYSSAFNPGIDCDGHPWTSAGAFGLDQGIVAMMIENHRSELIWRLMRSCPYVRAGLRRAGFRGGWLQRDTRARSPGIRR
ncbi:MAG: glucoamylase family protein [Betaproteobacteria bacterium]